MWYYRSKRDDSQLIMELNKLADKLPTRGLDEYVGRLKQMGFAWGRTRIRRVYLELGLKLRRKRKRRIPSRIKAPLKVPVGMNTTWSMDFMHDVLDNSRKFRVLNVIDDYNREAIAVEASHSFPATRVVDLLDRLILFKGKPQAIRVDNGTEFTSKAFTEWCKDKQVRVQYIQPGKPTQNAFIERFNRTYREDILDAYIFDHINEVKKLSEEWRVDYNQNHPHKSLKGMSPMSYKLQQLDTG